MNYMSLHDAAEYLGVTTKTIRRRIEDGSLPAYRMGVRLIRINRADLDNLVQPIVTKGGDQ